MIKIKSLIIILISFLGTIFTQDGWGGSMPQVTTNKSIEFSYHDLTAKGIEVAGFFNDWKWQALKKGTNGSWTIRIDGIERGTYTYLFRVDGKITIDPSNPKINIKPNGSQESILDVEGGDYLEVIPADSLVPVGHSGLMVLSLNTHSFQEKTGRFIKLFQIAQGVARLGPDLVALNEIVRGQIYSRGYQGNFFDTAEIIQQHIFNLSGIHYHIARKTFGRWEDGEELQNVILSKHPIRAVSSTDLTTTDFWPAPNGKRNAIMAEVEVPHIGILGFLVTHTMGYSSKDTLCQIKEIKEFILSHNKNWKTVVVAGDLNVWPEHQAYQYWLHEMFLMWDVFEGVAHSNDLMEHKIDHIFSMTSPASVQSAIIFNNNTYHSHLFPRVSDHYGLVSEISFAD